MHLEAVYQPDRMAPVPSRVKLHSRHKRGTQLHIALLGRNSCASLEVRGVVRAEKIEHAPHPPEGDRAPPLTVVSGRSAYVLRKGAIRSHSNWDIQMRVFCPLFPLSRLMKSIRTEAEPRHSVYKYCFFVGPVLSFVHSQGAGKVHV